MASDVVGCLIYAVILLSVISVVLALRARRYKRKWHDTQMDFNAVRSERNSYRDKHHSSKTNSAILQGKVNELKATLAQKDQQMEYRLSQLHDCRDVIKEMVVLGGSFLGHLQSDPEFANKPTEKKDAQDT